MIAWSTRVPGRIDEVYARRFSPAGEPLTAEIRVADGELARVAADADGNFLVLWQNAGDEYGRHVSAAGEPQGGEFRVNQVTGFLDRVFLTGDLAGSYLAGWERGGKAFARRLPVDGRAGAVHFSPEFPYPLVPGSIEFGGIEDDQVLRVRGVIRTGGALGEVRVDVATEPGDAEPGHDYRTIHRTLVFGEDDSRVKTFGLEILEDEEIEGDETLTLRLANPRGGAAIIGSPTARVGIFDDEFNPPELAPVPLGPERAVHAARTGARIRPQVAVSPAGEFVVVWETQSRGIHGQLFGRDAAPRGQELRIDASKEPFVMSPAVAFDDHGDFLVTWTSEGNDASSVFRGRHFSGDGRPLGRDFEIARAPGCGSNPFPECNRAGPGRLAGGIDGRFPAVWGIERETRFNVDTRILAGIIGPGPEIAQLELALTRNDFESDVAAAKDGSFVVAWSPDDGNRIVARRFDRSAQPVGEVFEISPEGGGRYHQVRLAMSDAGELFAVWLDPEGIVVRKLDRAGRPLTAPVPVPQFGLGVASDPDVDVDPAGNVVVVWVQGDTERGYEQDGSGTGIFARRFNADLEPVGGEFPVNLTTEGNQHNPTVAVGLDGRFMVAWESDHARGTDVVARAFAPSGCVAHAGSLCFHDGRFHVEIEWRDFNGKPGVARHVAGDSGPVQSDGSGLFYFFSPDNWEMLLKVLDGCHINGRYWVFAATATDVEYTLRVTDTRSNTLKTYFNPLGTAAPAITDTQAFATCP